MTQSQDAKPRLVLAYLVSARDLSNCWFCWVYRSYRYGSDLLALIAGVGISQPLTSFASALRNNTPIASSFWENAGPWFWIGVALALLWGALRIFIRHENIEKRAILALDCRDKCHRFEVQFARVVSKKDAIGKLNEMLDAITAVSDNAHEIWAWPWRGLRPGAEAEADKEWERIHKHNFKPAPLTSRQQRSPEK